MAREAKVQLSALIPADIKTAIVEEATHRGVAQADVVCAWLSAGMGVGTTLQRKAAWIGETTGRPAHAVVRQWVKRGSDSETADEDTGGVPS